MRTYSYHLLLAADFLVSSCRGWTPSVLSRLNQQSSNSRARVTHRWHRSTDATRRPRTESRGRGGAGVAAASPSGPLDIDGELRSPDGRPLDPASEDLNPEDNPYIKEEPWHSQDLPPISKKAPDDSDTLPRLQMDESPIPDYLIDMLKESGEIDENGNPVNDFFDPDEDEEFKAQRKQDEEENQVTYFDVPHGEMLFQPEDKKDTGSLMDTSITSAVLEFGFPVEFFLDMLCRWGVTPPINQECRLGDMVDAEQAAALVEALTGLDAADVHDNYLDDSLEDLSHELEIPLPSLLQACATHRINLPLGALTHLTSDEYKLLLNNVLEDGESSTIRKLYDRSRKSNRWSGQRETGMDEARLDYEIMLEKNSMGFNWKNGPPVLGDGEGEMPFSAAHISGRIFGEDLFTSLAEPEDEDEDVEEDFFPTDF